MSYGNRKTLYTRQIEILMKKETFDSLPYIARKELIDLRVYMTSAFESNAHLISEEKVDSVLYQYKDLSGQFAFTIGFLKFDLQKNINIYNVNLSPRSLSRIDGTSHHLTFEQLKSTFINWIANIVKMHEITQEYYNPYKIFYDTEFAEYFTNDDPDATVNPFEVEKQEVIYYFLTYAEKVISNSKEVSEDEKNELLSDISQLKDDIPSLTKKRFVSALSKFAQKTKKVGNKIFHEVFDVLKKEVIKKILYKGAEEIPTITSKIETWINLLN
jgi:hypothetical protein